MVALGRGSDGIVYAGEWITENGDKIPAACKEFKCTKDFHREYDTLKNLNHLFVIKLYGTWKINSKIRFEIFPRNLITNAKTAQKLTF